MSDKRNVLREKCYAKIIVSQENLIGYLRDVSEEGVKIDLVKKSGWTIGDTKHIKIIPDESLNIDKIEITIEIRWLKSDELYNSIGGKLISELSPEEEASYKNLLSYYN